ncbi:MAG TPA: formate dehydrogenase subunit alpha [Methanospirillum sp.]|nr:formate dehydrogenase subunit alpha [Methanospirillum sp.]
MTLSQVTTTCPYCATGCSLNLVVKNGKVSGTAPYFRSPVNEGRICPKGTYCHQFIHNPERLKKPLIRKGDIFYETDWDAAYDLIAERLSSFTPEQVAVLTSARCTNEDNYLAMKFARGVLRTRHIDHCARLCHAATMTGLSLSFGNGAMTNSIPDIGEADCVFCLGSNTFEQHPLIGRQIIRAQKRGARLIYADPRSSPTSIQSDLFIQFFSGSDVLLLNSIMGEIIRNNLEDKDFIHQRTRDYEALRRVVLQKRYEPGPAAEKCGIPPEIIRTAAEWIGTSERCSVLYAMGITRHTTGVDNVRSIANLMMLTGNIGRPGTGVNALRGQNNIQGACDTGCLPDYLPGYIRAYDGLAHRKIAKIWGFPDGISEPKIGYEITTLFEKLRNNDREIRAMYLIGGNPLVTEPDHKVVEQGIGNLDFLVVQDIFFTESCQYADVVLPAACWAEKDGTQTNTERRVQRIRKAVEPPGEAKPDYEIITQIACHMGFGNQFSYSTPEEIFAELCSVIPQYHGMTWNRVSRPAGISWPCPDEEHPGTPILYTERFEHSDGLGVFAPVEWKEPSEHPDHTYPFRFITGRIIWHWQAGSMTRRCKNLNDEVKAGYLEVHISDAEKLGIHHDEQIRVISRRGDMITRARVIRNIKPGMVFMPYHFLESAASNLFGDIQDLSAKIPNYRVAAVRIEPAGDQE